MDGKEKRLNQIFTEIKQLDPSILPDLNAMIRLYSQAQLVIGHLDADALYRYGEAYTKRKSAYAEAIENGHGTVAEKEAQAQGVEEFIQMECAYVVTVTTMHIDTIKSLKNCKQ